MDDFPAYHCQALEVEHLSNDGIGRMEEELQYYNPSIFHASWNYSVMTYCAASQIAYSAKWHVMKMCSFLGWGYLLVDICMLSMTRTPFSLLDFWTKKGPIFFLLPFNCPYGVHTYSTYSVLSPDTYSLATDTFLSAFFPSAVVKKHPKGAKALRKVLPTLPGSTPIYLPSSASILFTYFQFMLKLLVDTGNWYTLVSSRPDIPIPTLFSLGVFLCSLCTLYICLNSTPSRYICTYVCTLV